MNHSEIIKRLVELQIQLKFLHWQTKSYAKHQAYGNLYGDLDELIDDFVEACMGKHGRPKFSGGYSIEGEDLEEIELGELLTQVEGFLISFNEVYDPQADSDLLNIRDEMLSSLNKLRYLLTLN